MAKGDILIAEDDAVLRNLYIKKFATAGYDIRTAEDGEKAMEELQKKQPDVLILDIHMPKMTGLQVLEVLQKVPKNFPVIVLSNFSDDAVQVRCKELGADDYFVKKDMTIRSLLEMAERLLAAWKASHPQ